VAPIACKSREYSKRPFLRTVLFKIDRPDSRRDFILAYLETARRAFGLSARSDQADKADWRDNWTWSYSKLASYVSKFHATLGKETARTLTNYRVQSYRVSLATRSAAANRDGSSLEREFRQLRANRRGFALDMRERAKFAFLTAQRTAGKAVRQGGEAKLAQTS